jgi:quercetin dioxygenase-like cupin family protein
MSNRIFKIKDIAKGSEEKALKTVFYSSEATSGSVWVVHPGQEVQRHMHSTSDDVWVCINGQGVFYPELGEEVNIERGDVILSEKGRCHGMNNTGNEDFVFISIVAPVPADFNPLVK